MKIAIVAPVMNPVPPKNAGGISVIANEIACGLAGLGNKVTIFCSGESTIESENLIRVETSPYSTMNHLDENRLWEFRQFLTVLSRQNEFDIIHFHYEPVIFNFNFIEKDINLLEYFSTPLVLTFHNPTDIPVHLSYYKNNSSLHRYPVVFVSENQRRSVPFFSNYQVIYNGLPIEKFQYLEKKEDYLIFLGRLTDFKGVMEAIKVAQKTKIPLIIIAKVEPNDHDFYDKEVKRHIDGKIIRHIDGGKLNFKQKIDYLKRAKCLLFPILWEEPFGLVMAEALACGTPVVAFRRGSVPEIIEDGVNGFIVDSVDEMAKAVEKVKQISPAKCRSSVEKRFSVERMVNEYEDLFKKIALK